MSTPAPHLHEVALRRTADLVEITLARPDGPFSLTSSSTGELLRAVRWAESVPAHVLVLRGRRPVWCVGGDIREFARAEDVGAHLDDLAETLHTVVSRLIRSDMIVVAAVDGVAAGAGLPLAAAADIVVASEDARFTLGYTRLGLTPDGGTSLLSSTWGLHRTLFHALTNPMATAADAHEAGLVAIVAPAEEFEHRLSSLVSGLLAGPPRSHAATKHLVRGAVAPDAEARLRLEALTLRAAAGTGESTEGIAAFLDKRAPVFGRQAD